MGNFSRGGLLNNTRLEIGDTSSAIIQLQKAQSAYPLKSIAELVENGIDSGSAKVEVTRCKRGKGIEILVTDYGRGVTAGSDGNCDMHRVRTSICDSEKIRMEEEQREKDHVIGEFGIGVLGFPAIGENLEMLSRTETSTVTKCMQLRAFSVDCKITSLHGSSIKTGTKVRVYPVHNAIIQRITGEKIAKYLGKELATRIRETSVIITVYDNIRKRTYNVKPLDFKGEKIVLPEIKLPDGRKIKTELHVVQQGDTGAVSLIRKGTKVLDDITKIDELNHEPWNSPLLEGRIHNRFISPTPGRTNILFDENFTEFIEAMRGVEGWLINYLETVEENRGQKLNSKVRTLLRSAFSSLMANLSSDYIWFNEKGNLPISKDGIVHNKVSVKTSGQKKFVTIAEGPLSYIQITPSNYSAVFGETVKLNVTAWTSKGHKILKNVKYEWRLSPATLGNTSIYSSGMAKDDCCEFIAGDEPGEVEVRVRAILEFGGQKDIAKKIAHIYIDKSSRKKLSPGGFLNTEFLDRPGESWRSRIADVGYIEINMGHPDFKMAKKNGDVQGVFKYVFKIYVKHLVMHSFSGQGEEVIAERMIEVFTTYENKNGKGKSEE